MSGAIWLVRRLGWLTIAFGARAVAMAVRGPCPAAGSGSTRSLFPARYDLRIRRIETRVGRAAPFRTRGFFFAPASLIFHSKCGGNPSTCSLSAMEAANAASAYQRYRALLRSPRRRPGAGAGARRRRQSSFVVAERPRARTPFPLRHVRPSRLRRIARCDRWPWPKCRGSASRACCCMPRRGSVTKRWR